MSAYNDLMEEMEPGETVEAIVFGEWGWGGYGEPKRPPVPQDKRGRVLSIDEARPLMDRWSFNGGFGAPDCYAVRIWTNQRVLWVTQYDGSTRLDSTPRHPVGYMPDMPGG